MLQRIMQAFPDEQFLTAKGFGKAIIGVDEKSMRIIYSVKKCIIVLMKQGMNMTDAREYFDYNISGAFLGGNTPIWCEDDF